MANGRPLKRARPNSWQRTRELWRGPGRGPVRRVLKAPARGAAALLAKGRGAVQRFAAARRRAAEERRREFARGPRFGRRLFGRAVVAGLAGALALATMDNGSRQRIGRLVQMAEVQAQEIKTPQDIEHQFTEIGKAMETLKDEKTNRHDALDKVFFRLSAIEWSPAFEKADEATKKDITQRIADLRKVEKEERKKMCQQYVIEIRACVDRVGDGAIIIIPGIKEEEDKKFWKEIAESKEPRDKLYEMLMEKSKFLVTAVVKYRRSNTIEELLYQAKLLNDPEINKEVKKIPFYVWENLRVQMKIAGRIDEPEYKEMSRALEKILEGK